jgi:hypothetical protein
VCLVVYASRGSLEHDDIAETLSKTKKQVLQVVEELKNFSEKTFTELGPDST